jgi:gliding motility associated protien GldN
MLRSTASILFLLLLSPFANAQCSYLSTGSTSTVLNGAYIPETVPTKQLISYTHLREADVLWSKRVWRIIDLREKINQPLYYPIEPSSERVSLFDLMKCSIESGNLTAYNPGPLLDNDQFTVPFTSAEVRERLISIDTVWTEDLETGELVAVPVVEEVESSEIKQYLLKEDWFFDRQRGVMEVRIIGIAPMQEMKSPDGDVRGYAPLFWVYFPEARYVLANSHVFNRQNDVQNMSFDDLFAKRYFSSYITKESNVFDRKINEEYQGINALLQADQVKSSIFKIEHDLWHF